MCMESDFRSKWSKGSLKSNAYSVKCVFHLRTLFYIRVKKGWSSKSKAITDDVSHLFEEDSISEKSRFQKQEE